MTYTWQIVNFETRDQTNSEGLTLSDAVVKVKWRRVGVDSDDNSATVVGYTVLSAEDCLQENFSAFADLTEAQVISWLESNMSDDLIASYNTKIQDKINNSIVTERARPW
jgi:hypothetical protein|tara:strand:+ start:49 stop:378 length:330 start_codon:yes stop_codon:yes gene_type:complete